MKTRMLALVQKESGFSSIGADFSLESLDPHVEAREIEVPKPRHGQVLIRVRLASVNPSDIAFIKGVYGQPRKQGIPAGFEGVGDVVASGGGFMARRLVGRRVSFIGGISGTWSEYALAPAEICIPLRKEIRDEDAAGLIVNPLTAVAMFDIVRKDGAGSFVVTAGASQLSKLLASLAKSSGVGLISIVRRDEQIEPVRALGAKHVLNSESENFGSELRSVLKQEKPRIFLDAVTGHVAGQIFRSMGKNSRWIIYGRMDTGRTEIPEPGELIFLKKRIEGFWLTDWLQKKSLWQRLQAIRKVQSLFTSGIWSTDVEEIIPLAEAHARLPAAMSGANTGKVFLKP